MNLEPATRNLQLATLNPADQQPAPLNSQLSTLNLSVAPRKTRRKGRIAALPRLQREMVNRMLWNSVPYKNIIGALGEAGYTATERNVSNWATGGHIEWRIEQEAVLQNRLDQDHMLDFLRRDDAPEIPEVGLQAAATRLSQVLLQKLGRADDPEANLDNYSRMVDLLCRLNREIASSQKQRDDAQRSLGAEYDPARVKEADQIEALENERFYSDPPPDSRLQKPSEPPALPPIPTGTIMFRQAEEERHEAKLENMKHVNAMMKAMLGKSSPNKEINKS
ncbi:MAG: hypothetical protein QOJ40_175 [Verrucomicrobiota bacterium]